MAYKTKIGACCIGLTAGMGFGPALIAKTGLRRTSFLVGWIPAACWLLMYAFLNFPTLIVSFLIMGKGFISTPLKFKPRLGGAIIDYVPQ